MFGGVGCRLDIFYYAEITCFGFGCVCMHFEYITLLKISELCQIEFHFFLIAHFGFTIKFLEALQQFRHFLEMDALLNRQIMSLIGNNPLSLNLIESIQRIEDSQNLFFYKLGNNIDFHLNQKLSHPFCRVEQVIENYLLCSLKDNYV